MQDATKVVVLAPCLDATLCSGTPPTKRPQAGPQTWKLTLHRAKNGRAKGQSAVGRDPEGWYGLPRRDAKPRVLRLFQGHWRWRWQLVAGHSAERIDSDSERNSIKAVSTSAAQTLQLAVCGLQLKEGWV
ncbi:hypothetical protein CKAH01_12729 [Colletotrichum kahawae]|uniref:Uncharacterized protein n=1 Tax=Colletotrichum kahawae TaxID=34407 RepID=A0AAE0DCF3_COLKA|nr:hypothetical protein CKAH01_12729 [Colletotrichum kahawae]